MSLDIADFLFNSKQKIMFVESPVGTGKSLGSLVPLLINTNHSNNRILYATSTRNLQNQIMRGSESELEILNELNLIKKDQAILAMGKDNYFCQSMFEQNKDKFNKKEVSKINKFIQDGITGTRNELEDFGLNLSNNKWKLLSLKNSKSCLNDWTTCPGHRYRHKFNKNNKLTVTNHNQFIQSILNNEQGKNLIVPITPGLILIDEAHDFESNFLSCYDEKILFNKIESLFKDDYRSKIDYEKFEKELNSQMKEVKNSNGIKGQYKVNDKLRFLIKKLERHVINIKVYENKPPFLIEEVEDFFNNIINSENYTSWISFEERAFHTARNDFRKQFKELIKIISKKNKIIFMSGTLTTSQNINDKKLEVSSDWGLDKNDFIYKSYKNEFSNENQIYLNVPLGLSRPNNSNHFSEIHYYTDKVIEKLNNSGILILCTSYDSMEKFSEYLKNKVINRKILVQGEKSTEKLGNEFKEDINSILIGSGSFYSGFSVPGKALQGLVLDKLPYPVPDDPLLKLKEKDHSYDKENIIKKMMFKKLTQGMGRLIRTKKDYGIISIIDPRVIKDENVSYWFKKNGYIIRNDLSDYLDFETKAKEWCMQESQYNRNSIDIPNISVINDNIAITKPFSKKRLK